MTWERAEREFVKRFADAVIGADACTELFGRFRSTDEGQRLILCVLIDVLVRALDVGDLSRVLATIFESGGDPCEQFHERLIVSREDRRNSPACLLPSGPLASGDRYERVLTVADFLQYYLPHLGFQATRRDLRRTRKLYFSDQKISLGSVRDWWGGGGTGVVWVTAASRVDAALADEGAVAGPGTLLNDLLALQKTAYIWGERQEMGAVMYPRSFDESVRPVRPTVLDVPWTSPGWLFLSAASDDGWGFSHSSSGASGLPERIHAGFRGLTESYSTELYGVIDEVSIDRTELIQEGLRRLMSLLDRSNPPDASRAAHE